MADEEKKEETSFLSIFLQDPDPGNVVKLAETLGEKSAIFQDVSVGSVSFSLLLGHHLSSVFT
uniref:Uncharacterized protein n=1 Tax=Amphimedon queenslandica TaxID=400682 RepID=A0A1X7T509_AMPQE